MAQQLLDRLQAFYDQTPGDSVMQTQGGWPAAPFGNEMAEVRAVAIHETSGWSGRDSNEMFVRRYTVLGTAGRGEGPQFLVSGDGTTFRLIALPRLTHHATYINGWALAIELGHTDNDPEPPPPGDGWREPGEDDRWIALSPDPDPLTPGVRFWVRNHNQNEIMVAWSPVRGQYTGPAREAPGEGELLFTEAQYRSLALLCRYLAEDRSIPRNVPLLPWEEMSTERNLDDPARFRRIAMACETFQALVDAVATFNANAASFTNDATLQPIYSAEGPVVRFGEPDEAPNNQRHNKMWRALVSTFRGFHGHSFSGAVRRTSDTKVNCPGPLFDWHRFAREISDYWWYPFDLDANVARRPYQRPTRETELVEYYFKVPAAPYPVRVREGVFGPTSSARAFTLGAGTPVYAMANGELVAARFPPPGGTGPSMAFTLLRHELFHKPGGLQVVPPPLNIDLRPFGTRIDYDSPPSHVYSLTMHLGRAPGMAFDRAADGNPDWLNRVLLRKRECDLGISMHDAPDHGGIPNNAPWNAAPPGNRLTVLESWRVDQPWYDRFLTSLAAGELALAPLRVSPLTPIKVLLGDFLGHSGVVSSAGPTLGVRIEIFGMFVPPGFSSAISDGWAPPAVPPAPHALWYRSEWVLPDAIRAALPALGLDPNLVGWWGEVAEWIRADVVLPADAKLSREGSVFHYDPLEFMRWINDTTWRSEWPKNRTGGVLPARPRSRRV